MYIRSEWRTPGTIDVYKRFNYHCEIKDGKIVRSRAARSKPTPEVMKKYNKAVRDRRLLRKINANFQKGDMYLTMTYMKGGRPSEAQAEKNLKNYREAVRRLYKKAGAELKWVACTEVGSRGGIHHHMILNAIDGVTPRMISDLWEKYGGYVQIQFMRGYNFGKLAEYISKTKYSCSRNLYEPPEHRKTIKANSWRDDPVIPKGWMLDKDSLYSGINPVTGRGYQFYRLIKLE